MLDNGRWQNVEFEREICFLPYLSELSAKHLARAVIEWLTLNRGYQKYKDTYNPGYFTEAYISNTDDIVRELPTLLTTKSNSTASRGGFQSLDSGLLILKLINRFPCTIPNNMNPSYYSL